MSKEKRVVFFEGKSWYHRTKELQDDLTTKYGKKGGFETDVYKRQIFLLSYGMGIGIYISTKKHYRRGEEHGSAKWGNVKKINRRYREKQFTKNKLLTCLLYTSLKMWNVDAKEMFHQARANTQPVNTPILQSMDEMMLSIFNEEGHATNLLDENVDFGFRSHDMLSLIHI